MARDIETWKGTVKGPGKIVAVLQSDKYPMELRCRAAFALVELEHPDVDGVAELQKALGRLDEGLRHEIVRTIIPQIETLMAAELGDDEDDDEGDDEPADGFDAPPRPAVRAIRAKDAAYLLIGKAGPPEQKKLIDAILAWYTVDFNGRSLSGDYSAEQVVRSLGEPAAARLVDALDPQMPQMALVKLAELIGQLGSNKAKEAAAERLVKIEKEMESKAFFDWLEKRLVEQLGDKKVDEKRLRAAAALNREVFITEGALPAMKFLADQDVVSDRLVAIAMTQSKDQAGVARRQRALQALEGNVSAKHLKPLTSLALGTGVPVGIRDYAFDRVGDIRSRKTIPSLWPLFQNSADKRVRWRAGELLLSIGGPSVVDDFFARLPSGKGVEYPPEELEGYAQRLSQMSPPPRDAMRKQLSSTDWWDQVIALRFLERRGESSDAGRMRKLAASSAEVNGANWPKGQTVGGVTKEALQALQERVSESKPKKAESGAKTG